MKRMFRFDNMTTLTPFEQMINNKIGATVRWDDIFDLTPTFSEIANKDKYPKYSILKNKKEEGKYKISIAAAGMKKEAFKITTLKNKLCVVYDEGQGCDCGPDCKCDENEEYEVITSTISKRKFTQYFTANENYTIKVVSAELKDGMLEIDVEIEIPEDFKEKVVDIK